MLKHKKIVYFVLPLLPIFIIFFIGCIAETNRAPFDLAEAESELVSGFMTEHSAAIFVFFFLAEYASIILICIFSSILFLGGYLTIFSLSHFINIMYFLDFELDFLEMSVNIYTILFEALTYSLILGLKLSFLIFVFIWVRASFPRIRFDQLMSGCWTILLPIIIGFIVLFPCLSHNLFLLPPNFYLI